MQQNSELNTTILAMQIENGLVFATVRFLSTSTKEAVGKEYTYKTDLKLSKGDLVVVEACEGYKVAQVVEADTDIDFTLGIAYKWVLSSIQSDIARIKTFNDDEKNARKTLVRKRMVAEARKFREEYGSDNPLMSYTQIETAQLTPPPSLAEEK